MSARADSFDLGGLKLSPGEARRLDLDVALGDFAFSDERYDTPARVPVRLDVSRMVGGGWVKPRPDRRARDPRLCRQKPLR